MYCKNRAFYTGDLLLEIRLDLKLFVTGFQRPDSQYKTAEPFLYMSHHGMVPGAAESIPQLRIIPEFRKGRQSLLNMMAVAGGRRVHYHAVDHIVFPIGSQGMKYLFQANFTGGQVTAALFNRRQKLMKRHFLFSGITIPENRTHP